MKVDFSHRVWEALLRGLGQAGRDFLTLAQAKQRDDIPFSRRAILKHDVDRLPGRALALARLEASFGVATTYFFRVPFPRRVVQEILDLGHEVGYHYEDLCACRGDAGRAWRRFRRNLEDLRGLAPVEHISAHGSPFHPWDNRELWTRHHHPYHSLGVSEFYLDLPWDHYHLFTDVGRCWNGRYNRRDRASSALNLPSGCALPASTFDLLALLPRLEGGVVVNCHPERWTSGPLGWTQVLCLDLGVRLVKSILGSAPDETAQEER